MTQINPITGSVVGMPAAERAAAGDKAAQLKRIERNRKNTPTGDSFERSVQSPDELDPISDEHHKQQPRQPKQRRKEAKPGTDDGGEPTLDITA